MEHLNEALIIMVIGMFTVFVILTMVVFIGKITILITNKYWPENNITKTLVTKGQESKNTLAAIVAAVDIVTQGRGKVSNIKKV